MDLYETLDVMSTEVLLTMMGAIPFGGVHTPIYESAADVVGDRLAFYGYSDEALDEKMAHYLEVGARGFYREAEILKRVLVKPSNRCEAARRAWGIMNGLGTNFSHAVHLAAQDILNGREEYKFTYLTEPVPGA